MGNRQSKKGQNIVRPSKKIKIVLLGSASTGKSTLYKSIHISYKDMSLNKEQYPSPFVIMLTVKQLRSNAVHEMIKLLQKSGTNMNLNNDNIISAIETIVSFYKMTRRQNGYHLDELDYDAMELVGDAMDTLWNMDAVQQTYKDRMKKKYEISSNMDHFYNKIKYIMSREYVADIDDFLKVRMITIGCDCTQYTEILNKKEIVWEYIDVGGAWSERKRWIDKCKNVSCILYVCALNQYCLASWNDRRIIGLNENLMALQDITNTKWFNPKQLIVLLNKTDLFRKFLKFTPLTFCFGDEYDGRNYNDINPNTMGAVTRLIDDVFDINIINIPHEIVKIINMYSDCIIYKYWLDLVYKDGIQFIKQKFLSIKSDILIYEVSAINPEQVKKIIDDIKHQLVNK